MEVELPIESVGERVSCNLITALERIGTTDTFRRYHLQTASFSTD